MSDLDQDRRLALLELMVTSREGDRREGILYRQGKGWFQIGSVGHEGLAVLGLLLHRDDYLFPHYRDRALVLARGMTTLDCARGFFGKPSSSSGGRQLPSHFSSRKHHIWSMPSPTGSNLLPACGAAWGMQMDGLDAVVLACVGDAGMRQGEFYEAFTFAVQLKLPVVFLVEDNRFGISTPTDTMNPLRLGIFDERYLLHADGRKIGDLYGKGREAISHARSGKGPMILWCELDRLCSHSSSDDQRQYVSDSELDAMGQRDPLAQLESELLREKVIEPENWHQRVGFIRDEVARIYEQAAAEEDVAEDRLFDEVLGPMELEEVPDLDLPDESRSRIVDALNALFRQQLKKDRRTVFFGEDVADPMGGVFKLTKGLSSDFPDRVFNSPLAESTIVGVGCGLASYGMRPVFELQFIDFVGPAWNQIVTNLSTLRWRSKGEWECPLILYAPSGAYLPGGGPWHSQSNESAFAHVPGLRICVPSNPQDAAGLMATAFLSRDPTIFLIPKHLLRMRMKISGQARAIPFGHARQVEEGYDVTLVAWGNCLEQVDKALDSVRDRISADVWDLRTIIPWDRESIKASVLRTGRLVVVQEDNRASSVGQMIIQELVEDPEVWSALRQPPKLLSRPDVHVGFHPNYEWGSLPLSGDIRRALFSLLQEPEGQETPVSVPGSLNHPPPLMSMPDLIDLHVPSVGEGLEEARILKFFKQPGDPVAKDEPIYQLETDKAVVDVESPAEGVLNGWQVDADTIVEVGSTIGTLRSEGAAPVEVASPTASTEASRPLPKDNPELEYEEQELSASQQMLAGRLARAVQVAVPATLFQTVSWESILSTRREMKQREEADTCTSFSMAAWCVVDALKQHPVFRSSLPKSSLLRVYKNVHLGVAVSLGEDLTTAVVENAETVGYREFARRLRLQVERARKGQDQAGLQTSVILTSLTGMQVRDAIPVIVPPAMATLGFSSPYEEVYLDHGEVKSRTILNLSLTIDHRVVNGSAAAAFLNEVKNRIEAINPEWLESGSLEE